MTDSLKLIESTAEVVADVEGVHIKQTQEIPDWFLSELKDKRFESSSKPTGEMHQFAEIPARVYYQWLADGYDATKEPAWKTILKLHKEGLDAFIVTNKNLR